MLGGGKEVLNSHTFLRVSYQRGREVGGFLKSATGPLGGVCAFPACSAMAL